MIVILVLSVIYWPLSSVHAASISTIEEYRDLGGGFCDATGNVHYYTYFTDPHPIITFNSDNTWTISTHESCDAVANAQSCEKYILESVRRYGTPDLKCINCPYHLDTWWSPTLNPNLNQVDNGVYTPMFGPCLNAAASLKMPCLQHHALYPQKFFGRYFFPTQKPFAEAYWDEWFVPSFTEKWNTPMHPFLKNGLSSSPYNAQNQNKPPSEYGLGRSAVEDYLNSIRFIFSGNKSINVPFTEAFKRPYLPINSVEQWMKWAQYFCLPGCHKNSRYSLFRIRDTDIAGDPELSYLSLYTNDTSPQLVTACRPCPNHTASYNWIADADVYAPAHPKTNILADQCYPWFGAIPTMTLLGETYVMNITYDERDPVTAKVFSPRYDTVVDMDICPVNTYNRVCAHTKESIYNSAFFTSPPSADTLKEYACTPCPQGGYHTAGKQGQWYCNPPHGKLFVKRDLLIQKQVWGDREKMGAENYPEMECGPYAANCRQCADFNRPDITPETFNEEYIFSKLLAESWCPERSYCPDAFTQLQCPSAFPWSPVGSWHVSNCTCEKGKYFNGSSCLPCTSSCDVKGYYLPISKCMAKNGATKDAPCAPCDNLPDIRAEPDGVGTEYVPGYGSCPFHCILGSEMYVSNASKGACDKKFSCKPLSVRTNNNQNYVYKEDLSFDSLDAKCQLQPLFSVQLSKIGEWQVQPSSCIGPGVCNSSTRACYARNQSLSLMIDTSIPWYSFSRRLTCEFCPNLPELPTQSYLQNMGMQDLRLGINYCQNPPIACQPSLGDIHYFNNSAWECQSCNSREKAICPPQYKLRGGGCLNSNIPFNQTNPLADCLPCPIPVPDFNISKGKQYLNYMNSSAAGGCSIDVCPALSNQYYWKTPCGGDSMGKQMPCTRDCNPFFEFRKTECSADADLVCQNCTVQNPGFQKVQNCSLNTNSIWKPCDAGYYCDFNGQITKCPADRTTVPGADDLSDCFCKVGMKEDPQTSACIPMQCENTVVNPYFPGKSLNSSSYMRLDLKTMSSTECVPCNTPGGGSVKAYTRGDGLGIESCVCPRGFYGVYPSITDKTSIVCTSCPSTTSSCTSQNNKQPVTCVNGDVKVTPGQLFPCTCTNTPFAVQSPSTCTVANCISGFFPTQNTRSFNAGGYPQISGSSLYAGPSTNWKRFIETTGFTPFNNTVRSIAVTGCMDDSVLGGEQGTINPQAYHYEYLFWILADPNVPNVFSVLLQEGTQDIPSTQILTLPDWEVFTANSLSSDSTDILVGLATSKWNTRGSYYTARDNVRDPWVYVAVLVRPDNDGKGLFYMKAGVFNTSQSKNYGEWEKNVYNITLFPPNFNTRNAIPVSISHSTKNMGDAAVGSEGGYFFTAFNTWDEDQDKQKCGGIVIVSPIITASQSLITSFCNGRTLGITSMALTLSPESSMPMALVSLSSGIVLKVETTSQTDPSPFFQTLSSTTPFKSTNIIILFSLNSPIYISGMFSEGLCSSSTFDGSYCLKAADSAQLSWVDIQGLPWGTAPTNQPFSIAASVMSQGKALLVVTRDTSIFTIVLYRCPSPTQYWDGVTCVEQTCLRQASCAPPMIRTTDGTGCVCGGGYYLKSNSGMSSPSCTACNIPNYCYEGTSRSCPYGTTTTINTASSINDCICSIAGMFFDDKKITPQCIECKSNDAWCPNRWQSFSCPGIFTLSPDSSLSPIAYPTKCTCAPGYTGANCELCPNGFYCPSSASSLALNTAAFYTFSQPPLTSQVMAQINTFFLYYFKEPGTKLPNFATQVDLSRIMYLQVIPATNRTQYGIMIMIQIDMSGSSLSSAYDNFKRWHGPLWDYLKSQKSPSMSISVSPSNVATTNIEIVQVNKPVQCIASKVPGNPPSLCICAPGYETNKEQCSACAANTFKASAGPGTCAPCAIGTVSSIKATVCISDPALLGKKESGAAPNTMLLVGGIGGGVVGLILLLFLIQGVMKRSHKN